MQPRKPRLKWNRANEARWRRQGEGGHQVVRYNATQHYGKWLCMRCGLHYVRFCDLRTKQCAAAPASQAATKAIADTLAGGSLTRRKVHAFAKHPSGSRPGAPGARLPSDVITLDPHAPRPAGPANSQAQDVIPVGQVGSPQGDDLQQGLVAGDPARVDVLGPPELPISAGLGKSAPAHGAQNGDPLQHDPGAARPTPSDVPTGGGPGVHDPTSARPQDVRAPWVWSLTMRRLAEATTRGDEAGGPGTYAPCWVWGPAEGCPTARTEQRSKWAKQGSRRSPRPSEPQAGRPASGPASPGPYQSPRGIPRATCNVGSCPVSLPSRQTRVAPPGRQAGARARPRTTAAHWPAAEWSHSRARGTSQGLPAARRTPPRAASSAEPRTPPRVVGAWAMRASKQPGALGSTGSRAASGPKRTGRRSPTRGPAPAPTQAPSVRMKTLSRG